MQLARPKIKFFVSRFSLGNRAVAFFYSLSPFFTFYDSATGRCCVQCVVALWVSAFSFGVYTPLVISDISLTTPYNVLYCILRVLGATNVCEDSVVTEYNMSLVKWPTYWKQTTLPTTQV